MHEIIFTLFQKHKKQFIVFVVILSFVDCVFLFPFFSGNYQNDTIHFLDVGQGDAELVVMKGTRTLIDTGTPNGMILNALAHILPPGTKSLDLVVISHPEADHMGGLLSLINTYKIGAVLYSGRDGVSDLWRETKKIVEKNNIQLITLLRGDKIYIEDALLEVLSPDIAMQKTKETNESSIVLRLSDMGISGLFVGDLGFLGEKFLKNISIAKSNILKVGHHGSKYSSSDSFLKKVQPNIAVIEVGKNSYGHPTQEVLSRLIDVGAKVFRTDKDGAVTIEFLGDGKISVYKQK